MTDLSSKFANTIKDITENLPFDPRVIYNTLEKIEKSQNFTENFDTISTNIRNCPSVTIKVIDRANRLAREKDVPRRKIDSLTEAVSVLGFKNISEILYSVSMNEIMDRLYEKDGVRWNFYKVHSISAGVAADEIANLCGLKNKCREDFYSLGIFSNIGRIIFHMKEDDDYYEKVEKNIVVKFPNTNREELEVKHFSHTHSRLGEYVADMWGLPTMYGKSSLYHEDVKNIASYDCEVKTIILANILSKLSMPVDRYTDDPFYSSVRDGQIKFIDEFIHLFSKSGIFEVKKYNDLKDVTRQLIMITGRKSESILQEYKIPVPGREPVDIEKMRGLIVTMAKGLRKDFSDNGNDYFKNLVQKIECMPTEIALIIKKTINENELKEKIRLYKIAIFYIYLSVYNILLSMAVKKKCIPLNEIVGYLKCEYKFGDLDSLIENVLRLSKVKDINIGGDCIKFIENHVKMHQAFMNGESYVAEAKEKYSKMLDTALFMLVQVGDIFTVYSLFYVNQIDFIDDDQNEYFVKSWNKTKSRFIKHSKIISKARLMKNAYYCMDDSGSVVNLVPFVNRNFSVIENRDNIILFNSITGADKDVIYVELGENIDRQIKCFSKPFEQTKLKEVLSVYANRK